MSIMASLHQDHINMSKLLDQLDMNIEQITTGGRPEIQLMAEAVEYIGHYADLYHHPIEDMVYAHFAHRSKGLDQLLNCCKKEHQELACSTQSTLVPIMETLLDGMLPIEQIVKALQYFIKVERAHINFEEAQVFPMIAAVATPEDWKMLRKRCYAGGQHAQDYLDVVQYRAIYSELCSANGG